MKKVTVKLTAVVLSLVFMFSGMFSLLVSADEAEPTTCLEDHFSNLNVSSGTAVPPNASNSCSYVAMSMLLSFYDSYWDDDFVVEDLDWDNGLFDSSTETLSSTFSASSERQSWIDWQNTHTDTNFVDYELANQSEFLQPYLISLGRFAGYHSDIENKGYVLSTRKIYNFLSNYVYDVRGFTEDQITIHMQSAGLFDVSQEALNEAIIEQIENGFPVIYCGLEVNNVNITSPEDIFDILTGHAMVAYGVDDNGDIMLHTGWNRNEYTTVSTTDYQYFNTAIWIEINYENLPHNCSNNYYDSATNSLVCACNLYYESHPSHTHFHYDSYDSVSHFGECICGNVIESAPHNLRYSGVGATNHVEKCVGCNYNAVVDHSYTAFVIDTNGHRGICACGQISEIEEHYNHHYARNNTLTHYVYCECGRYMGTSYHVVPATGNAFFKLCIHCGEMVNMGEVTLPGIRLGSQITFEITEAGSYVDSDGIIYLVESDMALYLAGELDIYSLVNNNGDSLS